MKMVLAAYNEAVDDEMMRVLSDAGVESYTKWTKVMGRGGAGGPHLSTHVWPKANNVLAICVDDDRAGDLMDRIRELRREVRHEGVKAFLLPVEAVTGDVGPSPEGEDA